MFDLKNQGGTDQNVLNEKALKIDTPLPGVDRVTTARIVAFFSDITCGENCWNAKEDVCRCECGGRNHGIHLRGENAVRACRINGRRYELVSVGKRSDLLDQVTQLVIEDDIAKGHRRYDPETGKLQAKSSYSNSETGTRWFNSSYVHPSEYQGNGSTYVLKYATLSQCLKWQELAYLEIADERDRYHSDAGILWKRADLTSEVTK